MNISSITILIEEGPILEVLKTSEQINKIFSNYSDIQPDHIFELNDSVYVTDSIGLTLVEEAYFEVKIFVKFVALISDITEREDCYL